MENLLISDNGWTETGPEILFFAVISAKIHNGKRFFRVSSQFFAILNRNFAVVSEYFAIVSPKFVESRLDSL